MAKSTNHALGANEHRAMETVNVEYLDYCLLPTQNRQSRVTYATTHNLHYNPTDPLEAVVEIFHVENGRFLLTQ